MYLRRDRLDRTDDFDVFDLFSQHTQKESTDWSSPHTTLVCSVPSANLLQLCRIESPFFNDPLTTTRATIVAQVFLL